METYLNGNKVCQGRRLAHSGAARMKLGVLLMVSLFCHFIWEPFVLASLCWRSWQGGTRQNVWLYPPSASRSHPAGCVIANFHAPKWHLHMETPRPDRGVGRNSSSITKPNWERCTKCFVRITLRNCSAGMLCLMTAPRCARPAGWPNHTMLESPTYHHPCPAVFSASSLNTC